ncbi:MAG: Ig-like domain-containing protein [Anaerolineales bacterium]|nr:Ig-like domain-containing protein [Anaerolineales bacterium]
MKRFFLFSFLLLVLLLTAACDTNLTSQATPPAPPSPTPTAQALPPSVVETVPPVDSQVGLQSPITVYFSEPMERASVEAALRSPNVERFLFQWLDDATLQITPVQPFQPDSDVQIVLATSAKTARGLSLLREVTLTYRTAGLLRVAQVLPAPQADAVNPAAAIVAAFNQPVVPLGADSASLPPGFTLEPAAKGRGEWLNTSTYIFYPELALSGGVEYVARINPALKSTASTPLDADSPHLAWSFRTALPKLLEISPAPDSFLPLDGVIQLTFNQPMDRASVQNAFALRDAAGTAVAGRFDWNERGSVLTFTPASLLPRDTNFTLSLSAQEARALGGASLEGDLQVRFVTYRNFAFDGANIAQNAVRPPGKNLVLYFSAPLPQELPAQIREQIVISPTPARWELSTQGMELLFYGNFSAGQTYTITLPASLTDRWGQSLGREGRFTFREPDAYPVLRFFPFFFEAFRVVPDAPVLSVDAVNIKSIRLESGELTLPQMVEWMTNPLARETIAPLQVRRWEVRPNLPRNVYQSVELRLSETSLPPGSYLIQMTSPDIQYPDLQKKLIIASHIHLVVKSSQSEVLVWAVDTRTLQPVTNTALQVFDQNGQVVASGLTDGQGIWRGALPENRTAQVVVLGQPGQEIFSAASPDWNLQVSPADFTYSYTEFAKIPFAYLYSDRPIYRPGDTVLFWGALRERFDGRYTLLPSTVLTASVTDYNTGQNIYRQELRPSDFGTFSGQFKIPKTLPPGNYSLILSLPGDKRMAGNSLNIQVADYRKPEINLSVELQPSPAQSGQPVSGQVRAEYFFGAPAADLPFEWRLYSRTADFPLQGYQTGRYAERWLSFKTDADSIYQSGTGRTDSEGRFILPLDKITVKDTTELTLEVTATESGGFPVSARATLVVHPDSFYIGIRPQVWLGQAGSPLFFDLLTADWKAQPVGQKPLMLEFKRVRWEQIAEPYATRLQPVEETSETQSLQTDAEGRAQVVFTPDKAGTYLLEVTSGAAKSQILMWVGGKEAAPWPNLPDNQLRLTANQQEYTPGQTAEVFIPNPFGQTIPMMVSVERGNLKDVQVLMLPPEGYRWKRSLTEADAPNIYVAATVLGPEGEFRQGYVNLLVDPSALELNITLKTTPQKARPGDTVTIDLTVTDQKGQPLQARFALGVVDLALLALAEPNSEDIVSAFYDIQPLNVLTGLTAAIDQRRFLSQALGLGGGGGDAVLQIRENFLDTAFWKADIVTDSQGKARLTITLPDNLTTWQIESRGLTRDTRVGQARVQLVASKDLLIRPQTPRFVVVGDVVELSAIVNNTTDQPIPAVVSLKAEGFVLEAGVSSEQNITVPAGGRVRVAWRGTVQDVEALDVVFAVTAAQFQDAARPNDGKIPVLRYIAPQTFSTAGILSETSTTFTEILSIPRTFRPLGGELNLELSPSLASTLLTTLEARTLPDPVFSTEQILSYLLPNTVTYLTLQRAGLENAPLSTRLQRDIPAQTVKLLAAQQPDGGWGWGLNAGRSDAFITAYLLFGLEQVRLSGLADEASLLEAIKRGRTYLFSNAAPFTGQTNLSDPQQANLAVFYVFVLQRTGGLNTFTSLPEQLYGERDRLDPWAKAMLAVTLSRLKVSDARIGTLFSEVEATAIRSATGAHWESRLGGLQPPASPLYTTAIVLYTLTERDPASPLAADAARYLVSQRGANGWASDYENAWVLLALNRWMLAVGEFRADFGFSAALNGVNIAQGEAAGPQNLTTVTANTPLGQIALNSANQLTITRTSGVGRLYYRAALKILRPVETAPALNQGIVVHREYLECAQDDCRPVTSYQMREDKAGRITVRLTVTLPHEMYYFLLEDYIPAGAEILDPSLLTSQQGQENLSAQVVLDEANPLSKGWGWWFFSQPQIYRERIVWSAEYLPAGTYVLTYTLTPSVPGEYRVLPAHAWLACFPEVQGTTAGVVFRIEGSEK